MEFSTTDQRKQWLELVGNESGQEAGQWVMETERGQPPMVARFSQKEPERGTSRDTACRGLEEGGLMSWSRE